MPSGNTRRRPSSGSQFMTAAPALRSNVVQQLAVVDVEVPVPVEEATTGWLPPWVGAAIHRGFGGEESSGQPSKGK